VLDRFRVAYRFDGMRREVLVHVYETVDEMQAAAKTYDGRDVPDAGAAFRGFGYWVPGGMPAESFNGPIGVVLLCRELTTVEVVSHEMTHAAMHAYESLKIGHPDDPLGEHFHGGNEAPAYFVGGWTANALLALSRRGYAVTIH